MRRWVTLAVLGTSVFAGVSKAASRSIFQESDTQFLTDGDPLTYWSTPERPDARTELVSFDLGTVIAVGRVGMLSRSDNSAYFPRDFEIQVSRDNIQFTTVRQETGFTADPGTLYTFDVDPPASGRYVRILVTRSNPTLDGFFVVQIAEVAIHEAIADTEPLTNTGLQVSLLDDANHTSLLPTAASAFGSEATATDNIEVMNGNVMLSWVAPGDSLNTGTASAYEIRYDRAILTEENFVNAPVVPGVPLPEPAGTPQSHTVRLAPGLYYFAIVAFDEAGNRSPISNVVSVSVPCFTGCSAEWTDKLTWDASSGEVTEYRIYIAEASGAYDFGSPTATVPATDLLQWTFANGSLQLGTNYRAVVTAVDADGNQSGPSNEVDFVIIDTAGTTALIQRR